MNPRNRMIVGAVNQNLEAAVPSVVGTPDGRDREIEAVIDTVTWIGREDAMLGDGHIYTSMCTRERSSGIVNPETVKSTQQTPFRSYIEIGFIP